MFGDIVAPFAGAWIEIPLAYVLFLILLVAPFAGAWIEIAAFPDPDYAAESRSLCGSVD